jgi:DNA-binding NarL/FixJ family response regulator
VEKKNEIRLVISDIIMPKISGLELSEKLTKVKKDIKILKKFIMVLFTKNSYIDGKKSIFNVPNGIII